MEPERPLAPSVVAVVVVHDPGDWFDQTLAALAAQDYPNLRFLFLVDGAASSDEVDRIRQQVVARLPAAFVRGSASSGSFGATANEILRLVEGDNGFFLICHDDIAPAPDAVRLLVSELYRSNAGMVGPKLVEWDEPRRLQHVGLQIDRFGEIDPVVEPGELDQEQHDAVRDVFVLPSACVLVRADLFRAIGGFDPGITFHGDDIDLCWRAHLTGARVVVAPDARVRHLERLEDRRPDLDHRRLRSRHRVRALAVLTGPQRILGRSVQLVVVTLLELVVGLFTGRVSDALSSLRAMLGLIPKTPSLIARRRAIAGQRIVPEREILGLQLRGSARLTSYVRGRETTTYIGATSTVRRWRDASYAPLLAWFLVIVALVVGSRAFIDRGVPQIGEFLAFPESARDLLARYGSGWDTRGFGATAAVPTGFATLAGLSAFGLFRMDLAMTASVLGLVVAGAAGAWRLAGVFPVTRARVAAMIAYAGTPLLPGVLATGRFSALVWYAALPWALHLLRRAAGIGTADPGLLDTDLPDGIADPGIRQRIRYLASASLVLGVAAAFVPVVVVLWVVAGLVVAVATLLAGGALRTAGWFTVGTLAAALAAAVVNLPWAATWSWSSIMAAPLAGARGTSLVEVASLSVDGRSFAGLALAFYLPVVVALAITGAWRLTWAARAAGLVVVFGGLAILLDHDVWSIASPDPALLMVPVALGFGLSCAAVTGSLGDDVRRRGFGWRQPAAVAANLAIVVGLVPALVAIGDGAWGTPRSTLATVVGAQLPPSDSAGHYRVLFVGDPRVLPLRGVEYERGIAYAVVDGARLDFTDRWPAPVSAADDLTREALDRIADGGTLRSGRLLAPLGIRYVVVPEIDGVGSTVADPIPVPDGLLAAMRRQLDLGETFGAPNIHVFENRSWLPVSALLTGPSATASSVTDVDSLVAADRGGARPLLSELDPLSTGTVGVEPGVAHLAVPFDERWTLRLDGAAVEARPGFGVTTAFDLAEPGVAEVDYRTSNDRRVAIALQTLAWLLVFLAATRLRVPFGRARPGEFQDDTLIELDDELDPDDPVWAQAGVGAPPTIPGEPPRPSDGVVT
ncbi:MAG: glycosyltransferase [Ilumatobacteraceae bacterium]